MDKKKQDMKAAAAFLREVLKDGRLAVTVVMHRDIVKVLYKLAEEAAKEQERIVMEEVKKETNEPNIIYKSRCPELTPPWYYCRKCNYRLSLDHVYCPKCGIKLNWGQVKE